MAGAASPVQRASRAYLAVSKSPAAARRMMSPPRLLTSERSERRLSAAAAAAVTSSPRTQPKEAQLPARPSAPSSPPQTQTQLRPSPSSPSPLAAAPLDTFTTYTVFHEHTANPEDWLLEALHQSQSPQMGHADAQLLPPSPQAVQLLRRLSSLDNAALAAAIAAAAHAFDGQSAAAEAPLAVTLNSRATRGGITPAHLLLAACLGAALALACSAALRLRSAGAAQHSLTLPELQTL